MFRSDRTGTRSRLALVLSVPALVAFLALALMRTSTSAPHAEAQSGAPGVVTTTSPTNGATGVSRTPTLSWSAPTGAVSGTTTYRVDIWAAGAPPAGHLLGSLATTTSLSKAVPTSTNLFYGRTYYWNVVACNGTTCSGYNPTWASFTVQSQPAATASGAIPAYVVNGDFSGTPASGTTPPGWTGTSSAYNGQYVPGVQSLTSTAFTLDYPSLFSKSWFRIGYRLPTGGNITVKYGTTTVLNRSVTGGDPANTWQERLFSVPSSAGSGNSLVISSTVSPYADVAYVERLDGPSARGVPRNGMTRNSMTPFPGSATIGKGVDAATGAFMTGGTDLALPGRSGYLPLDQTRSYSDQAITAGVVGGVLTQGPLGPKWSHTWQYRSWTMTGANTLVVQAPGGGTYAFDYNSTYGVYTGQEGINATIDQPNNSFWTLTTYPDDVDYEFTKRTGMNYAVLTAMQDRNGNRTTLTYDSSNRLTKVTDSGGRFLSFTYDASNRVSTVTDSSTVNSGAARSVTYTYSSTTGDLAGVQDVRGNSGSFAYSGHWLTSVTDQLSHTAVTNTYDGQGRVITQVDAGTNSTTIAYASPSAGVTTMTNARSNSTKFYFDGGLRVTDVVDAAGGTTTTSYGFDNVVTRVDAPLGRSAAYTHDSNSNVASATDALNYTSTFTYDGQSNLLTATDPLGHTRTFTYDVNGNPATAKDALNNTTTYTVNALGQMTTVKDARNNSTTLAYNTAGDLTTVTDPLTHATTITRDSAGRATAGTDALSHVTSLTYDNANHVLTRTNALNQSSSAAYDAAGRRTSVTDANNNTSSFGYDNRNLLTSVTDPVNGTSAQTGYSYDAVGNLSSSTNARGKTSTTAFDSLDRPTSGQDPLSHGGSATYDAAGRTATSTDANGHTTTYTYDGRDRVTSVAYYDSTSVSFAYDGAGRKTGMTDSTGTTTYAYDNANRLTSVTFPGSRTVSYGYDAVGNRTSITYPGGTKTVTYVYDAANRMTSVTDWNSKQTTYTYDNANRLTGVTLPTGTGVTTTYTYDNANRVTAVAHTKSGTTITGASYTLDANGNRTGRTVGTATDTYAYDGLNRMSSSTPTGGTATSYTFNATGNRLTSVYGTDTTTSAYDDADRVTSITPPGGGSPISYTYDNAGQLTNRGSDTFAWNAAGRLSSATVGGTTTTATYDGTGLRQSRTTGGTTTSYVWDVARKTPQILDDGTAQYVYGMGRVERVTASATHYYLTDGSGSTLALVDSSGTVVQSYDYDAWGNVRSSSGTSATEFQYTGEQRDPTGLIYLRARYYDPMTGSFLSSDPMGTGYSYASGNPASRVDPLGLLDISGIAMGPTDVVSSIAMGPTDAEVEWMVLESELRSLGMIPDPPGGEESRWYLTGKARTSLDNVRQQTGVNVSVRSAYDRLDARSWDLEVQNVGDPSDWTRRGAPQNTNYFWRLNNKWYLRLTESETEDYLIISSGPESNNQVEIRRNLGWYIETCRHCDE